MGVCCSARYERDPEIQKAQDLPSIIKIMQKKIAEIEEEEKELKIYLDKHSIVPKKINVNNYTREDLCSRKNYLGYLGLYFKQTNHLLQEELSKKKFVKITEIKEHIHAICYHYHILFAEEDAVKADVDNFESFIMVTDK